MAENSLRTRIAVFARKYGVALAILLLLLGFLAYSQVNPSVPPANQTPPANHTVPVDITPNPTPQTATLLVIKHVINDNQGSLAAQNFLITVNGVDVSQTFSGSEDGVSVTLFPGDYGVTEKKVNGYNGTFSPDCSGSIAVGEVKTCIITNDDVQLPSIGNGTILIPPLQNETVQNETQNTTDQNGSGGDGGGGSSNVARILVIKHVINNDGGIYNASDFTMIIFGATENYSFPGKERGVRKTVHPGKYNVTESGPSGYEASFSEGCEGTIAKGQTKTCTITNDDIAPVESSPVLTVIKHVINDNGGTENASDFTILVNTESEDKTYVPMFPGSEEGTNITLGAGEYYNVAEYPDEGYASTFSEGCSGTMQLGDHVTCTITNDDIPTVELVAPAPGNYTNASITYVWNSPGNSNCTLFLDETTIGPIANDGGASVHPGDIADGPHYWNVTCTDARGNSGTSDTWQFFVNSTPIEPAPILTVYKHVINHGSDLTAGDFSLYVNGTRECETKSLCTETWQVVSFQGSENGTQLNPDPGAYLVGENPDADYVATYSGDCNADGAITLTYGDAKTCTITNEEIATAVPVVKIERPNPKDGSIFNTKSITINYSATNVSGNILDSCWYEFKGVNTTIDYCKGSFDITADEGSNSVIVYANNTYGNIGSNSTTFFVDTVAPATTATAANSLGNYTFGTWSTSPVNVTLSCADPSPDSGCNAIYYCLVDSSTTCTPTTPYSGLVISTSGIYYLGFYSKDNAGNSESVQGRTVAVDLDLPDVEIQSPTNSTYNYSTFALDFTASDATSGLNPISCYYQIDGKAPVNGCANDTITPGEGSHEVTVTVFDFAGNSNFASVGFTVATQVPEVPVVHITNPKNTTYNTTALTLNYTVSGGSIDSCWYKLNNGTANLLPGCAILSPIPGLANGSSTLTVYANNTAGSIGSDSVHFTIGPSLTPSFTILLTAPANNSHVGHRDNITLNYTVTDSLNITANCTLFLYEDHPSITESATTQLSSSQNVSVSVDLDTHPGTHSYLWNVTCSDSMGNWGVSNTWAFDTGTHLVEISIQSMAQSYPTTNKLDIKTTARPEIRNAVTSAVASASVASASAYAGV